MLDANTTNAGIIVARVTEWETIRSVGTNFEDIFPDGKLHIVVFCLGIPELMTSYLVLSVIIFVAFDKVHLCRSISKPYRTTVALVRKVYDELISHHGAAVALLSFEKERGCYYVYY
jgi:hypothetical protein